METKEAPKDHKTKEVVAVTPLVSNPLNKDIPLPKPLVQGIPDGAIDPNFLRPGYGPLEGSPKENDPTQLANPNNPNSPITKPVNPSNPANMPATQSEKPASEVRMFNALISKDSLEPLKKTPEQEAREKSKAESLKKIGEILAKFNNNESEIPANSEYWTLVNQYRAM